MLGSLSDDDLRDIFSSTSTIAMVGATNDPSKAGNRIPSYLKSKGFRIVPVNPKGGEILGERAYRSLEEIDFPIDVVDVYRPPEELPEIARQAAAIKAKVLWMQPGTASEEAAAIAEEADMQVVYDVCMGETHAGLDLGEGPYVGSGVEVPAAQRKWTLVAVVLGSGVVFLDSTIVNVALPQIGKELHSSFLGVLEAQSYVYYGYLLALSALLILAGALSDYHGRKKMFSIGLLGFGITSALCGIAPNFESLIAFRVLQGAAGAILVPGSLALVTSTFHGEEQGRAFGIWAGASAATTILGPVVGGAIVTYVSWRAAFLINAPLVAFALWATSRHVVESRDDESTGRVDWLGAILVAVAVGGLTFGTIRGQSQSWSDAVVVVSLALGAIAAVSLPIQMLRSSHPLIPPSLFRSRNFTITNLSTLVIYGAIYVTFYFIPLFAIGVLGYTAVGYGLATIPALAFLALFSSRFGKLAVKYGPRIFMTVGPTIMGLGVLWLTRIPAVSEAWKLDLGDPSTYLPPGDYLTDLFPALLVFGTGLMMMVAPLTSALMSSVPERNAGVASAFNNAISRVGPQLAGALIFVAVSASFYSFLDGKLSGVDVTSERFHQDVAPLNAPSEDVDATVADASRDASTDAFHLAMTAAALLCFGGAAINGLGIRNPVRKKEEAEEPIVCPGVTTPAVKAARGSA